MYYVWPAIYRMIQLARQLGIAIEQIQQRLPKPSYMEKTEFNTRLKSLHHKTDWCSHTPAYSYPRGCGYQVKFSNLQILWMWNVECQAWTIECRMWKLGQPPGPLYQHEYSIGYTGYSIS